jgi:hypothetical protein
VSSAWAATHQKNNRLSPLDKPSVATSIWKDCQRAMSRLSL